jgi:hypothetical protein
MRLELRAGHPMTQRGALLFVSLVLLFLLVLPTSAAPPDSRKASAASSNSASGSSGSSSNGSSWSVSWSDKAKEVRPYQGPRFTDNGDGSVTDNRTGLVWLKHASCFKDRTWEEATNDVAQLAEGSNCDGMPLKDGSKPGDWRMPTIQEIMTLPVIEYFNPALSNTAGTAKWSEGDPFVSVIPLYYWSSTRLNGANAWYMYLYNGVLGISDLTQGFTVWPVRGVMANVWRPGS